MSPGEWISFLSILCALSAAATFTFRALWTIDSRFRTLCSRLALLVLSTLFVFLVAELIFFFLPPATDSWAFTLASKRWMQRYWHLNSNGYRDPEHTLTSLQDRKLLLALGDSFTAGWGIEDYRDRYQNVLVDKLGDDWTAMTVAEGGWGTDAQLSILRSLQKRPEAIVLQYYVNDIEGSAALYGKTFAPKMIMKEPPPMIRALVRKSYFLDFIYWRIYRFTRGDVNAGYHNDMYELFSQPLIWNHHHGLLRSIVNYARERNIPLYALVIPNLMDMQRSRQHLSKVIDYLRSENVRVIDVAARLEGEDPGDLIVNNLDSHANERLHALMAGWLFDAIGRQPLKRDGAK